MSAEKDRLLQSDFAEKLAARGLPADASLDDLIQHERGQMGMSVAFDMLTELNVQANRLEAEGDTAGAATLRNFAANGGASDGS